MDFAERLTASTPILTEGAITTRLVYDFGLPTPESASFVHLSSAEGRAALSALYRGYMSIARASGLAMKVATPTWRAHPDALARLGFTAVGDLERIDAVDLLLTLRREMSVEDLVYVAATWGRGSTDTIPMVRPTH